MTLEKLSRHTNMSVRQLDYFELGKHDISVFEMAVIARRVDVDALRLMT